MELFRRSLPYVSEMLTFNVALYAIVVGATVAVIKIAPSSFKDRRRIGTRKRRPGQIRREILTSMRSILIFSLVAAVTVGASELGWLQVYDPETSEYSLAWGLFATLLLIVLQDTWFYWTHRAFHHRLLYKRFHSVHHKSRYPTPYTSYAFDSGEAFSNAIYIAVAAAFFPIPIWGLGIFMIHMLVRNAVGHSGYSILPTRTDGRPFIGLVTSTLHHDMHHTANRGNFGLYFTFWDRVMGTEHPEYMDRLVEHNRQESDVSAPALPVS